MVGFACEALHKLWRGGYLVDEDAVVGDLLFKDINSALHHLAVAMCTYHIANGAYRYP